jgi:hypothetical protein
MATLTPPIPQSVEENELLLITHPILREQLLQARMVDEFSARSVIQRGEQVYLSLREISDPFQRRNINWAILRLQMGATLTPKELPEPLKTALTAVAQNSSPLIDALIWGSVIGVVGGVLVMAVVGLVITILNVPVESYVGITATGVAFVLAGTFIGLSTTIYLWRKFTHRQHAAYSPLL